MQHIAVDGKLQKSSYTNKENQKVYKTSVYVMDVELALNNATMPQTQAYQNQANQNQVNQFNQPQTVPFTNQVNYQSYPNNDDLGEGMPF